MIIVTIIRVSGLRDRKADAIDIVWEFHWQWIEACIGITMVSLTAFRSFFLQHSSRNQPPPKRPWYTGIRAAMTKHKSSEKGSDIREWPHIPGGTLSGMRTFIHGIGETQVEEDGLSLQDQPGSKGIRIEHNLSIFSETVSLPGSRRNRKR